MIALLSAKATVNLPESWFDLVSVDKLGHAVVYALLTLLILRGFYTKNAKKVLAVSTLILAVVISSAYGVSMEIMQYAFFPNRFFEVLDIIANIIGSIIGVYIFKHFFYS